MIVCHCHAINDRTIREVVRAGACSPRAVAKACGAGGGCGGCRHAVERIIETEQQRNEPSALFPADLVQIDLARAG